MGDEWGQTCILTTRTRGASVACQPDVFAARQCALKPWMGQAQGQVLGLQRRVRYASALRLLTVRWGSPMGEDNWAVPFWGVSCMKTDTWGW